MRGMQCPKMLWLDKHRPDLKVIPPEIQAKLDAGNDFGDLAMETTDGNHLVALLQLITELLLFLGSLRLGSDEKQPEDNDD